MLRGRRESEVRRNSSDTKGGRVPGPPSQQRVIGVSDRPWQQEAPNELVTWKSRPSRVKRVASALGQKRKYHRHAWGETDTHTHIWHTVSKATELPAHCI